MDDKGIEYNLDVDEYAKLKKSLLSFNLVEIDVEEEDYEESD